MKTNLDAIIFTNLIFNDVIRIPRGLLILDGTDNATKRIKSNPSNFAGASLLN